MKFVTYLIWPGHFISDVEKETASILGLPNAFGVNVEFSSTRSSIYDYKISKVIGRKVQSIENDDVIKAGQ